MSRVSLHQTIVLYLSWLAVITGAMLIALAGAIPFTSFLITPADTFQYLIYTQLFFVLVIWPGFIPKILAEESARPIGDHAPLQAGSVNVLLLQVVALSLFVLPIAMICMNVSTLDFATFFKGQLLVIVMASFVAALFALGVERKWKMRAWYYAAFFVASAGFPFAAFVAWDAFGTSLQFLASLSPFWAASHINSGSTPLVQSAIYGGATIGLLLGPAFLRRTQRTAA